MRNRITACACHPTRRSLFGGLAATALAGAVGAPLLARGGEAQAQPAAAMPALARSQRWIDVHHHMTPPEYMAQVGGKIPLLPPMKNWSLAATLDELERGGIATAMLSMTIPGIWFGEAEESRRLARVCNDYAAQLVRDHPGRFGSFAALPLPDTEGSLAEIAYALDTLKADGIGLLTSYGNRWLGDPGFAPVLDELNRRAAVVYTHPASPQCCTNLVPGVPDSAIEYGTDTTRTIASLVFSGAALKYPNIQWIFSHAGGTMPFLIDRFEFLARNPDTRRVIPNGFVAMIKTFLYDTAQASNIEAMGALHQLVGADRIVFGTDYPYRTVTEHVASIGACGFSAPELEGIGRATIAKLLPRVAAG